jgi:drug/metabolite transporter (DMT)-like permease
VNTRTSLELLILAAVWGGSFLFIRYAAPEFGVFPIIWLRVTISSLLLLPLLIWHKQVKLLWQHAGAMLLVGILSAAIPFVLIAWSLLSITAGLASILNASTPIFTALIGVWWLRDKLSASQWLGLAIGFIGVILLAIDKADFKTGGSGWAVVTMLSATFCYGISTHFTKRYLANLPALVNTVGSQLSTAIVLMPLAWWYKPSHIPSINAWVAVLLLAALCTAFAYLIFFRLIATLGASKAVTVTFLIPVFGVLWGDLFLHERVNAAMLIGGSIVVVGTALATGFIRFPRTLCTS